jgi:hypothetical protein
VRSPATGGGAGEEAPRRRVPSAGATRIVNNRREVIRGDRAVILAENDTAAGRDVHTHAHA